VETDDALDGLSALRHGDIIRFQLTPWSRLIPFGCLRDRLFDQTIGADYEQVAEHHCRIGDVEVGTLSDRLFHPIGQVAERPSHTLAADGKNRSQQPPLHQRRLAAPLEVQARWLA
jgi:hypothetical protein